MDRVGADEICGELVDNSASGEVEWNDLRVTIGLGQTQAWCRGVAGPRCLKNKSLPLITNNITFKFCQNNFCQFLSNFCHLKLKKDL